MAYRSKEDHNKYAREYAARWRKINRERHLEYARAYVKKRRANGNGYKMWLDKKKNKQWYENLLEYQKRYRVKNGDALNAIERDSTFRLSKEYLLKQLNKDGISRKIVYRYPLLLEAKKLILQIKRLTDGTNKKYARTH